MQTEIELIKKKVINDIKNCLLSTNEIVYKVVDTTTIRAFHFKKDYQYHRPLSIYRVWAYDRLNEKSNLILNCNNFEEIHKEYFNSFSAFWLNNEKISLEVYKIYKIVDLFFKGVTLWNRLSEEKRFFFMQHVHCPIDYFSLKFLKQKSLSLSDEIKDGVTMSFIKNAEQYTRYQNEIKTICNTMEITPYIFDEIAWKHGHDENVTKMPPVLLNVKNK